MMLFIAQINKADAGDLLMFKQPDCEISLLSLPYSIPV